MDGSADVKSDHKLCISRAKDAVFADDQFRDWLAARDLGLAEATGGAFGGQVTRAKELGHATGPHFHEMTFQVVYVLKGWVTFWYEGEGEFTFEQGDFVYHPPTAVHDLRDYSEDVELLELFAPAHPKTHDT
jgi:quercetin dioxygenase-like cupin family protein